MNEWQIVQLNTEKKGGAGATIFTIFSSLGI